MEKGGRIIKLKSKGTKSDDTSEQVDVMKYAIISRPQKDCASSESKNDLTGGKGI